MESLIFGIIVICQVSIHECLLFIVNFQLFFYVILSLDLPSSDVFNKSLSVPIRPDIEHVLELTSLDEIDREISINYTGRYNFPNF